MDKCICGGTYHRHPNKRVETRDMQGTISTVADVATIGVAVAQGAKWVCSKCRRPRG